MSSGSDLQQQLQGALGSAYTIERELGGGGMSRVFVAEERALGRKVVVKVLLPDLAAGVSVDRFRREIQLAAQLQHACIVPLLSAGVVESDGRALPYYTMPLVEGESLRARIAREGALPVPDVVRILRDVAEALSCAHERGIVHRDIKPDNILLTKHHALVADFGVAKALSASTTSEGTGLTSLGIALGTPAYMAPEQASADPGMDHRADLYALGATAYEMLTGLQVFAARSPQAMLAAQATETPVPVSVKRPSVPPVLAALVMRCLEKQPADRPRSADAVLQVLDGLTTPSGGLAPTEARPAIKPARPGSTKLLIGAGAAILVLAVGAGLWRSRLGNAAPSRRIERIALLPLANATGDSAQAFVADGLTREVISDLTSAGVRVIGYASVSGYSGRNVPLERIARELHVDAVAVGALRQTSPRVQVALELTDPGTRENIWSRNYSVDGVEMSGLASRTAHDLAGALHGSPSSLEDFSPTRSATRPAPSRAAYAEYLLGRHVSDSWTPQGYREMVDHYTRAVALDSTFAAAWASLAVNYATYGSFYSDWVPRDEAYAKAQAAADRALMLDDGIGEAHFALAVLKQFRDWDWTGAEQEFHRALELEPSSGTYDLYGWFLMAVGRREEAVAMGQKAVEIDPTSAPLHSDLGALLREAGQFERGFEEASIATTLDPQHAEGHLGRAYAAMLTHRPEVALEEYDRYEELFGMEQPAFRADIYDETGRAAEARKLLRRLEQQSSAGHPVPMEAIIAYIALGEHDHALELLRQATERHEFWWPAYAAWDPIRSDPRFQALVARFGFPAGSKQ